MNFAVILFNILCVCISISFVDGRNNRGFVRHHKRGSVQKITRNGSSDPEINKRVAEMTR